MRTFDVMPLAVDLFVDPICPRGFYEAFGRRHHVGGEPLGVALTAAALADAGLAPELADAATTSDHDGALRSSHERGMRPVGDDVGTPVLHIHLDDQPAAAIFGPVVNPAPRGDAAGRIWDAVVTLATAPEFSELKRSRRGSLDFT